MRGKLNNYWAWVKRNPYAVATIVLISVPILLAITPEPTELLKPPVVEQKPKEPEISKPLVVELTAEQKKINHLRELTGQNEEEAKTSLLILSKANEDNEEGYKLVTQLQGSVENPNEILGLASVLKTSNAGYDSLRQIINVTLTIAKTQGVIAKPAEVIHALIAITPISLKIGSTPTETASMLAMELKTGKTPVDAVNNLIAVAEAVIKKQNAPPIQNTEEQHKQITLSCHYTKAKSTCNVEPYQSMFDGCIYTDWEVFGLLNLGSPLNGRFKECNLVEVREQGGKIYFMPENMCELLGSGKVISRSLICDGVTNPTIKDKRN